MTSTATIGHNSGFEGYWELRMAIWDSKEPLIVKALALAVLEHMRPDMLEATPSRSRIQKMCGISPNTLERHWGAISQWIEVIKNKGRKSVYRARIFACASELIELIPPKAPPAKVATQLRCPPQSTLLNGGIPTETTPPSGGYSTPNSGGYSRPYKESKTLVVDDDVGDAREVPRDPVYVNGVGVKGPWFTIDHEMIRVAGEVNSIPQSKRLVLAELIARRWVLLKERPVSVMDALSRGMARQKLNLQCDEAKLRRELEKIQAEQRHAAGETAPRALAPPGQKHWREEQREKSKMITELVNKSTAGKR